MSLCLHCYNPIEKEKVSVLPEARYCIGCARLLNNRKTKPRPRETVRRIIHINTDSTVCVTEPTKAKSKESEKMAVRKYIPSVLMDQVFDDGQITQTFLTREKKKCKNSHGKHRYSLGEKPLVGDIIYSNEEDDGSLWVVDDIACQVIHAHQEDNSSRLSVFFARNMVLLYRREETE